MRLGVAAVGVLACAAFFVFLLPARALLPLAEGVGGLTVRDVNGRWWRGEAEVGWRDFALGRLAWQWAPAGLLAGELRLDWQLEGTAHTLAGSVGCGMDSLAVSVAGHAAAAAINPVLAAYDIRLGGRTGNRLGGEEAPGEGGLAFTGLEGRVEAGEVATAAGVLRWSGGPVRYRLGPRLLAAELPAMVGVLDLVDGEPALAVATAAAEPLFDVRLAADGWVHMALTRRFVDLAGNPWPGTSAADAVVIEVSRQLEAAEWLPLRSAVALRSTAGLCGVA